jgi:hypothetical protein
MRHAGVEDCRLSAALEVVRTWVELPCARELHARARGLLQLLNVSTRLHEWKVGEVRQRLQGLSS